MANRRMFSKDITRSDAFLDLPISSQALYFHLGMEADDRGYINNPKSVIRSIGASLGDLEQLANKRFILVREDGLILIKHWRINNLIKNDRFKETKYVNDLKKLFFDENNSYTETPTNTPCLQIGTQVEPQDRLGKDSIGEYRLVEDSIVKERKEGKTMINNDIPLFCESCVKKIFSCKYLVLEEYADKDRYLELFSLLIENYTKKNIVISLNYFIFQVCSKKWNKEKKCFEYEGVRDDYAIDDKYSYLRTSLYNSCEKFKDGYEAYLDKTNAYFDEVLEKAKLFYDYDDSKIKELAE